MRLVHVLFIALGLQLFGIQEAEARRGGSGYAEHLEFVAMTDVVGPSGSALSLCVLIRTQNALFVDLWRTQKGYALADNQCNTQRFRAVDDTQFQSLQTGGFIPANIPAVPQVKTGLAVPIWAWVVLAGLGALIVLKLRQKAARKSDRRALMGDASPAVMAILDAMCHAAKADGNVTQGEVFEIAAAVHRMTGEAIDAKKVVEMAKLAEGNLTDQDFKKFVGGRSAAEMEIMMRGVLLVSVADGKLDNKEQQFVGKLAKVMKMPQTTVQNLLHEVVASRSGLPA